MTCSIFRRLRFPLAVLLALCWSGASRAFAAEPDSFLLRDHDTVVFYGDSITEQAGYCRDIETFVLARYPDRHVHFITSGWGGDTARGGHGGTIDVRLKRDVYPYKPTVVTIFLGMNDGRYSVYDPPIFNTFARSYTHIVRTIRADLPHTRIVLITPSLFETGTHTWVRTPSYNETLRRYGQFVTSLGTRFGIQVINVNAAMAHTVSAARAANTVIHLTSDGVHPNAAGHAVIAAAILAAWHAKIPVPIRLTENHAQKLAVLAPWPLPRDAAPAVPFSVPLGLYAPMLLQAPRSTHSEETLMVDNQPAGSFSASDLAAGIDVSRLTDTPWARQSAAIVEGVERRTKAWHDFFKGDHGGLAHGTDQPSRAERDLLTAYDTKMAAQDKALRMLAAPAEHTLDLVPTP